MEHIIVPWWIWMCVLLSWLFFIVPPPSDCQLFRVAILNCFLFVINFYKSFYIDSYYFLSFIIRWFYQNLCIILKYVLRKIYLFRYFVNSLSHKPKRSNIFYLLIHLTHLDYTERFFMGRLYYENIFYFVLFLFIIFNKLCHRN